MSGRLEKFIEDRRDQFDDESPAPELWNRIREGMEPGKTGRGARLRSFGFRRWLSVAAAVLVVAAGGWIYFSLHRASPAPVVVVRHSPAPEIQEQLPATQPEDSAETVPGEAMARISRSEKSPAEKPSPEASQEEGEYAEEMYHYMRLVEIKHAELKTLQKDEPLLYRKFSGDVNRLDSVYQALKAQLPRKINREQLIGAMISNLQLQIGLLNKQLEVIKQIEHSKKSTYEKAFKSA